MPPGDSTPPQYVALVDTLLTRLSSECQHGSRSEARYRTLFDSMPLGVIAYDAEMHMTVANLAALSIPGLSEEALRTRRLGAPGLMVSDAAGAPLAVEDYPAQASRPPAIA